MFRSLLWTSLALIASNSAIARDFPDDTYVLQGDEAHVQAVRGAAIERSVKSVSWLFRGFARRRLNTVATACPQYRLLIADPKFRVECNGETVFAWTLGQTGTWTTETGDVVDVHLEEQPGGFKLKFLSGDSGKTFTYIYRPDGRLRVSQAIHSNMLPVPVEYGLDYVMQAPTGEPRQ